MQEKKKTTNRSRKTLSLTVDDKTREAVEASAEQWGLTESRAIDRIIKEWVGYTVYENDETRPQNLKFLYLEHQLIELSEAVDKIIIKLKRASL